MSDTSKTKFVKLTSVPGKKEAKGKTVSFEISRANKLLTMKKSAWKLDDPGYVWNGSELATKK